MKPGWTIALGAACTLGGIAGCGGRPSYWNDPVDTTATSYGLANGVALVDDVAHRVVIVTVQGGLQVAEQSVPIGHQVITAAASANGDAFFVLSAGDWPQRTASDQGPTLTAISLAGGFNAQVTQYKMSDPLPNLAIDPMGHWAIAYVGSTAAGSSTTSFLQNPNEIVLFDLTNKSSPNAGVPRTLQSFGGTPQQLVFTPELALPWESTLAKQERRLLLIESNIDVTMLDLDRAFDPLPPPEITVPLTSESSTTQVTPAGLAVDGHASSAGTSDARFAVWASNSTDVYTVQLLAPTSGDVNDFAPTINLTDVGGIPSDVAFVEAGTSAGLQVAALVPSTSSAVVFDPNVGITTTVALPAAYANFSLVTTQVTSSASTPGSDVALLWNASGSATSGVALWTLSQSVSQPYASIRVLGATQPVNAAYDVPPPNQMLKVLQMTSGGGFYVLNLDTGTAAPLETTGTPTITIAPDGKRLWAFERGGTALAAIEDFATLDTTPLSTDLPIDAVYDVARSDGGRALFAVHAQGDIGATIFDAVVPQTSTSRRVSALLLEGP